MADEYVIDVNIKCDTTSLDEGLRKVELLETTLKRIHEINELLHNVTPDAMEIRSEWVICQKQHREHTKIRRHK